MRSLKMTELLNYFPKEERPELLELWEREDLDFIVMYDRGNEVYKAEPVGPNVALKTFAKAVSRSNWGPLYGYTTTLAFDLKAAKERITAVAGNPSAPSHATSDTPTGGTLDAGGEAHAASQTSGGEGDSELIQKKQSLEKKEKELQALEAELRNREAFIEKSEAKLSEKIETLIRREAWVEHKEEGS